MSTAASDTMIPIVVVGAHLTGLPLNHELSGAGGQMLKAARTAPDYRLFALANTVPPKPGMVREPGFAGPGLEVEVWALPAHEFGRFVAKIPAPLGIGKVTLEDGTSHSGFLCEAYAVASATEVTSFGGWRAFVKSLAG
jgi:allophanate hydrolase